MSSVMRRVAQVPTRTFIITQSFANGEGGPHYWLPSTIEAWLVANASDIEVTGKHVIIPENFATVIGSSPGNGLESDGTIDGRRSLIDLGSQYIFGDSQTPRLIVLRRVLRTGSIADGGNGGDIYICVENNTTDLNPNDLGRWLPRVARM